MSGASSKPAINGNKRTRFVPSPFSGKYDSLVESLWRAEFPELDTRGIPLLTVMDILSVQVKLFHSQVLKPYGRNYGEYIILTTLLLNGSGLTPRMLADIPYQPTAAIAQTLNRLEADGLVKREANPEDRRSTLVTLTERGEAQSREICEKHARRASERLGEFDTSALDDFRQSLNKLIKAMRDGQ